MAKDDIIASSATSPIPVEPTTHSRSQTRKEPRIRKRDVLTKATKAIASPFKKAPATFPRFAELPAELRIQIWEESIEDRVHELHPCSHLYNSRMTFRSNASATPAIFHAAHESRQVALQNHQIMEYAPLQEADEELEMASRGGKGILRFYFAPKHDTLFLNSLMGLFVMFSLLAGDANENRNLPGVRGSITAKANRKGMMKGWQRVALDAERAQLITLLSGTGPTAPQPKFKELFPDLKELIVAFDYTKAGTTRFRTSVWPGENGTGLEAFTGALGSAGDLDSLEPILLDVFEPLKGYLISDYAPAPNPGKKAGEIGEGAEAGKVALTEVPCIGVAKVKRKRFIRGDLRYAFRWSCSRVGVRPRGVFRRL